MNPADLSPEARARLAYAAAAREVSDYARGLVGTIGDAIPGTQRIRDARELLVAAHTVKDLATLVAALDSNLDAEGTWDAIAHALGLPEHEARRRYEPVIERWEQQLPAGELDATIFGDWTTGLRHDPDPIGTAEAVDEWYRRHREPYDPEAASPVVEALSRLA